MFYNKCKKAISIVLLIFTSVVLSSCTDDNNDDTTLKPIYEISYTWNGELKTDQSTVTIILEHIYSCGSMYYDSAPDEYRYSHETYQELTDSWCIINLHKESSVFDLSEDDIGKDIFFKNQRGGYYKSKIGGVIYNYVYVDIINHQTLSITTLGSTTVYMVSSYKITYFDDLK